MTLPPGISASTFSAALKAFEAAVGTPWVFKSDEDVSLYRDSYSPLRDEPDERLASAAVAPGRVEEVQQIVRIANLYKIPIFPISTGKNLGYGGSAPNLSGSVIVDLKRMNRVLEVDDKRHFALLEPGVSYFDFYRYVQEHQLKVWIDCPDPGWGSPIGNSLDHGVGYTVGPFRNHFGSHCGMEVVLPNGELMRTGMGALPGAKTWQDYAYGFGPTMDGLFAQGNFGIVTKMGFWLLPQPEAFLSGVVSVPRQQDLIALVEIVNYLENSGISNGMPRFGSPIVPAFSLPDPQIKGLIYRPQGPDVEGLERYARNKGVGYWDCELLFYGPPKVIEAQWDYARERLSSIPGATFKDAGVVRLPMPAEKLEATRKVNFGIPNLAVFGIGARTEQNPNPSDGHVWFSPVIPRTGEAVLEIQTVMTQALAKMDIQILTSPLAMPTTYYARSFICIFGVFVSRDRAKNKKLREAVNQLIQIAADHGWGEYRTPPVFQDAVMNAYSFNDHSLRRFAEDLKDGVDPQGIMAPGRSGIWPKRFRSEASRKPG